MVTSFRRLLVVLTVFLSGWIVSGCSASSPAAGTPGAAGTSGNGQPAFMDFKVSTSSVVVANKAGQPLKDVYFSIRPNRGSSVYTARLTKMESSERREIPLSEFKTPGGLPWRGGVPREIAANATDFVGAKREMTLPLAQ
jgi:hypothetical protein